jgi:hypothetical protein
MVIEPYWHLATPRNRTEVTNVVDKLDYANFRGVKIRRDMQNHAKIGPCFCETRIEGKAARELRRRNDAHERRRNAHGH